jgi:hypothetical protein
VDRYSISIKVDGTAVSGDTGRGIITAGTNTGTINYSNGLLSVTFGAAPAMGAVITAAYSTGGFGTGTGLLDEDGTCPAKIGACWVPTDPIYLKGIPPGMKQDLDDFLLRHAQKYFSTFESIIDTYVPGILWGTFLGSWATPPARQVLQAAGQYGHLFNVTQFPPTCSNCTDIQARVDFMDEWLGDKPWFSHELYQSRPDSYFSPYTVGTDHLQTEEERGQQYVDRMALFLNSKSTLSGTYHSIGISWWCLYDSRSEHSSWGLLTRRDNPYDGVSAVTTPGADSWGYPTGCLASFGCEWANYGDFLGAVRKANLGAYRTLLTKP